MNRILLIIIIGLLVQLNIDFPVKYKWLWQPARYKVAHGGRWSWKSTSVARYIAIRGVQRPIRILCARETQKSIKESVHHLIASQIKKIGASDYYEIETATIKGKNGTSIFFDGLLRNVHNIKSLDDVDICWIEEAQNVSKESWDDLTPTIRKKDSEILITFNRKYLDDETDKRFVQNPPENSIVKEINYDDVYTLEDIPKILADEIDDCKRRDPTLMTYKHIYLNQPIGVGAKIWTTFNRAVHVITEDHWLYDIITMDKICEHGDCYMAMDPHSKYYPFCGWLAKIPKNSRCDDFYYVFYNEWPTVELMGDYYSELRKKMYFDGSHKELAKQIYLYDGTSEYGINIEKRFLDTRFAKGAGGENWSTSTIGIVHEFSKPENGGLMFELPLETAIDRQRNVIIDKMMYNNMLPVNEFNSPDFYVLPHCRNIIQSLESHRCIEGTEKEDEKYKDPSDMMRIMFAGMGDLEYTKGRNQNYQPVKLGGWRG
jgi:hypothetical protein